MKIYIKKRVRRSGQFQFYMCQFAEAAERVGFKSKDSVCVRFLLWADSVRKSLRKSLSAFKGRSLEVATSKASMSDGTPTAEDRFRSLAMKLRPLLAAKKKRRAIIVTSRGEALLHNAFPFFYRYEVIPMLWDVWPGTWQQLHADLEFMQCKRAFVTAKAVVEMMSSEWGIEAHWVPEGIDVSEYKDGYGEDLCRRDIEVYELGRQHAVYHHVLERLNEEGRIGHYCRNRYDEGGNLVELAFPTAEELIRSLPRVKIIISFPLSDTHPAKAGGLETLTQRYWEAMLNRCLILGRAPQELVELMGYNPVIDVDWGHPETQLLGILEHISDYQDLADRNYTYASRHASWDSRLLRVAEICKEWYD